MGGAGDALNYLGASEGLALAGLKEGQKSAVVHSPGVVSLVSVLEVPEGGTATVEAAGAGLAVPSSALAALGVKDAIVALTVLSDDKVMESLASADTSGDELNVLGAVNINLYSKDKSKLSVTGVPEPFVITIPISDAASTNGCAYWDEGLGRFQNLPVVAKGDGVITCETTHFTFFAAIWRGFAATLECANFDLLTNPASFALLGENNWWSQPLALAFWATLLAIGIMWIRACALDHYGTQCQWSDECWLIPQHNHDEPALEAEGPAGAAGLWAVCACCACGAGAYNALRDAFDDLFERLFEHVGEARDLLEGVCAELDFSALCGGGFFAHQCYVLVGTMVASSARRQTAAAMGLSEDIVTFILEDEDLQELLIKHVAGVRNGRQDARMEAWLSLHQQVLDEVDRHWYQKADLRQTPCMTAKLFVVNNPILANFLSCRLVSHSMRMLFFSVDLFGAFMLGAVFFDGSGISVSRRSRGACEAEMGPGELIGRTLAIALCSLFLAGIPVSVISALHTRGFHKVHHEGCEEWNRKLRVWRVQDKLAAICGGSYIAFCILFLCLFLANTEPDGLPDFGVSCIIQILSDFVIIPMATALIIPGLAIGGLRLLARAHRTSVRDLLRERRGHFNGRGNWRRLVVSV